MKAQAYVWKIKGDKWGLVYVHRWRGAKVLMNFIGAVYPKLRWAVLMPKPEKPTWGSVPPDRALEPFNVGEWTIKTEDEVKSMAKKKAIKFDSSKKGWETKPANTPSSQCETCGYWHHSRATKCPQCDAPTKAARKAQEAGGQKAEAMITTAQAKAHQEAQKPLALHGVQTDELRAYGRKMALLQALMALEGKDNAKRVLGPLMDAYGVGGDFEKDLAGL